jgi:hypothetical protein
MTDSNLIADFLARNGATVVPANERATSEREMFNAVRGDSIADQRATVAAQEVARRNRARQEYLAQRTEDSQEFQHAAGNRCVIDHAGREFWMNAEGEWL